MAVIFTPDTPLGQEVQRLLLEADAGMTVLEIRRALRLKGKAIEERNLRELLGHVSVFTSLAGDRFCLRGSVRSLDHTSTSRDVRASGEVPTIVNLVTATEEYVVVDLETTGLDPEADRVIQLVAVRYTDGKPHAVLERYLNPAPAVISQSIRQKLGLEQRPDLLDEIEQASSLTDCADAVRAFLGDRPIVAHNGRFDLQFLKAGLGELSNPLVDTLELALLMAPGLGNYQLASVAEHFGVTPEDAREIWHAVQEDSGAEIDVGWLHNAITDACLTAATYRRLLDAWTHDGRPSGAVIRKLLPELCGDTWTGEPVMIESALGTAVGPVPPGPAHPPVLLPPLTQTDVMDMLDRYRVLRGFESRAGQQEMLGYVWRALQDDRYAMIEAPTGTGKTVAYLLPALAHAASTGGRVVISTPLRNLQDQVLDELDALRSSSGVAFQCQVLKGAANYVCLDRLARYIAELGPNAPTEERFVLAYLLALICERPNATIEDLSPWCRFTFPITVHVTGAVSAAVDGCSSLRCRDLGCALPRSAEGARGAHVVVVNHALWLAEPARMPEFQHIIVDEAHALEDAATLAFTREVSRETLLDLLDRLFDRRTQRGAIVRVQAVVPTIEVRDLARQAFAAIERLRVLVPDFGARLAAYLRTRDARIDVRYGGAVRLHGDPRRVDGVAWSGVELARRQLFDLHFADLLRLVQRLATVAEEAADAEGAARDLRFVARVLQEQLDDHQRILRVAQRNAVCWIEVEATEEGNQPAWALKAAPIRVDVALQGRYAELHSAVFVSATLALRGGDFSYVVERLGLSDVLGPHDARIVQGDLDYAGNAFLGLTSYLEYTPVERTMESFKEELGKELGLLFDFTDGRALALFTSRERMLAVHALCATGLERKGIPALVQEEGVSRRQLQAEFAERTESVLFGLRSFWQGVDVPGAALSFVIMEKLPFPFVFDPVIDARREDVRERGGHEFDDMLFPLMAIQFKQGFGRLLRRKDDRGAVLLMDKRIHRKSYKRDLLASLPGYMPRDEAAERDRRAFYLAMAHALPDVIDIERKRDLLAGLPESLTPDLVARLDEYKVPGCIADDAWDVWRPVVVAAMREVFGFEQLRGQQEAVIRAMLTGHDVLAIMPTGSGKSLCFQLAALLREGVTVVFSPLIALMRDQVQSLNARGIEIVGALYSGQPADEREETLERMRTGRIRLVYIAPERIRDPLLLATLGETKVRQIVVDEAHCVAMWGPSFRPDFLQVPRLFVTLGHRAPLAAFTATAAPPIREEIISGLEMDAPLVIAAPIDRPELRFVVYNAASRYNRIRTRSDRFRVLIKLLTAADRERESALVYVSTTVESDLLARRLRAAGLEARSYHGKMTTADRDSVQELFMDDQINVVVCTKAFGMGIDKADIRYVIHYHMPGDLESYFQEAGRAGRDGQPAYCVLLYHPSDRGVHDYIIAEGMPDAGALNRLADALRRLQGDQLQIDPEALGDELGQDDVRLNVGLHLLEQAGFLRRGPDFTLRASLTLHEDEETSEARLAEVDPQAADLFKQTVTKLGWPVYRRIDLDLAASAGEAGMSVATLDTLLTRAATAGVVLYRPWQKGMTVSPMQRLHDGERYTEDDAALTHAVNRVAKLELMIEYAAGNSACRRETILRYFGDAPAMANCGACDVCAPEAEYPWSRIMTRETPLLSDCFDLGFTILETIRWNLDQRREGRNPYGAGTLIHVLTGDAWSAGQHQTDPHLRRWRLEQLRDCPWWGVFDMLPRKGQVLREGFERLRREGYIGEESAQFDTPTGPHRYTWPILLEKGREQLLRGELLGW